jgi:hypothetical protein
VLGVAVSDMNAATARTERLLAEMELRQAIREAMGLGRLDYDVSQGGTPSSVSSQAS